MPQGTSNPVWYIQRYIQRYIQVHTKLSSLYRFPKHHINGTLTWYITKLLWNFLGLFHEHISHFLHHQGQGCCLACIAVKFDKILKPGKKRKTGKYFLTPAVSEKGAHNEVLLRGKPSKRGTWLRSRVFPFVYWPQNSVANIWDLWLLEAVLEDSASLLCGDPS